MDGDRPMVDGRDISASEIQESVQGSVVPDNFEQFLELVFNYKSSPADVGFEDETD